MDKIEIILLQANTDRIQSNRELYGYGYDAYLYTDDQEALEKEFTSKGIKYEKELEQQAPAIEMREGCCKDPGTEKV